MSEKELLLQRYDNIRSLTRQAAAAMPEDRAEFRPTPEVMSFAGLLRHIVSCELTLMQALRDGTWEWQQGVTEEAYPTLRAVLELLERTTQAARAQFAAEDFTRSVTAPWGTFTVAELLYDWLFHEVHHRGQMFTYLRLCGVKPPEYH